MVETRAQNKNKERMDLFGKGSKYDPTNLFGETSRQIYYPDSDYETSSDISKGHVLEASQDPKFHKLMENFMKKRQGEIFPYACT